MFLAWRRHQKLEKIHPAYSNGYNLQKTTGVTQSDIFLQINVCHPGRRISGPPTFHMITMIDIDVLEQWWLAQVGLAAAGGPHNVQLRSSRRPTTSCGRARGGAPGAAQPGREG